MTSEEESGDTREEPLLRVSQLSVSFGGQSVLRDVSLEVRRGETLVIIGESGCGKTVLLKTLVGLIEPTAGEVFFDGESLNGMNERQLRAVRLRFGFVFQGAALFDSLNIYENVAFGLREHTKHTEAEIRDIVRQRLHEVGLSTDIVAKKPVELSGGMRKRVGVARAIALNPEVMLYDEPTTGLDPIMSDVVNELILGVRRNNAVTSVVVTHDMTSAKKIADRIVMLYPIARLKPWESQILFNGPPSQLERTAIPRVAQFVRGEARDRLMELSQSFQQEDNAE